MLNRNVNVSVVAGMFTHPAKSYVVPAVNPVRVCPIVYPALLVALCRPPKPPLRALAACRVNRALLVHESGRPSPLASVSNPGLTIRFALAIAALTTADGADSAPEPFTAVTR